MKKFIQKIWGRFAALLLSSSFKRAKYFAERFAQYLTKGETLLDLGCGTGHIGLYVHLQYGLKVVLADVAPAWGYIGQWLLGVPCAKALACRHKLNYTRYDGERLPYNDNAFDVVLVAFAMHHAEYPDDVLFEAVRVAKKRIVIFEDIPNSEREARLNRFADALVNLEFFGHPHHNRTFAEWESAFRSRGLKIVHSESFISKLFGLPFPNTMFILDK
jgi:ubiquinone/menaquinone biosynthesis C-methylase UbiE